MPQETVVFADCLGCSEWRYTPTNSQSSGYMRVSSTTLNNVSPLDLKFSHGFLSSKLTTEQNDKLAAALGDILKSIGAVEIKVNVYTLSPVLQEILVDYKINNVEQSKVDELTTTITVVCVKAIDDLATLYR